MILFKKKKWKLKDYEENIDLIGSEMEDVHEKLSDPDTTSEKRESLKKDLRDFLEDQQLAIRNKNEYKNGWVPTWIPNLVGGAASLLMSLYVFKKVTRIEEEGDVAFSGQGVNLWDKVVKKFF